VVIRWRGIQWLSGGLIISLATALMLDACFPLHLPDPQDLYARVVLDRDGRPLRAFPDSTGVWRYATTLDDVSPYYLEALLTYEDQRFWQHPGIDPLALARAALSNISNRRIVSGGSTLSMQVARLLHPHSRTLTGKLYQMLRTVQLEWHLSKTEILTLYCNIAPFGGTIEGVQAASYTYLHKPANQLTRAEAALLAVLPQSPTRFRPDLHPQAAQQARNKVLQRMVELNVWTQTDADDAKLEQVYANSLKPPLHAPLLARRLITELSQPLQRNLQSTIDGDLQASIEDYVRYYIESQSEKTSAAVLVVNNSREEVLAYVGTADFGNRERFGHVDIVPALRSPGSTLKPFLYAMAFDEGLIHSHSLLKDSPQHWQNYRPGNFSGGFAGPVSAAEALQRSLNVPAVALLSKFGPATFTAQLRNGGVPLSTADADASLAVILGGTGIRLEDLVRGYSAFANGGLSRPLRLTTQQPQEQARYLFSPEAAWVTQEILSNVSRPDGIRSISALAGHHKLAWKTGTSYGFRDAWAIGVDRNYTVGVWVGRPDGTANPGASGRTSAGPLLHAIVDHLPNAREPIPRPEGVRQETICWPLGTLVSEQSQMQCHRKHLAWIIHDTVPPSWPDDTQPLQQNPLTVQLNSAGQRVHSGCLGAHNRAQSVALWPSDLEQWLPARLRRQTLLPAYAPDCPVPLASSQVTIGSVNDGAIYQAPVNHTQLPVIPLKASGGSGDLHWYINGKYLESTLALNTLQFNPPNKGEYQIVVSDDAGNIDKVSIRIQ